MMLMATSLNFSRTFSCTAASVFPYEARLVPQPPDLLKLVRKEGGFVHHSVKIAFLEYEKRIGLGLGFSASEISRKTMDPYDCIVLRYDSALLDATSTDAGVSSPNFSSSSYWQQLLSQLNPDGENSDLKVRIGRSALAEGRLLAAVRVLLSDNEEAVQKHDLDTLKSISSVALIESPMDAVAFRTLVALCAITLGHFPTKIMEDEAHLKEKVPVTTELAIGTVIVTAMGDFSWRLKLFSPNEPVAAQ